MTDEEAHRKALANPDAQPWTKEGLKGFKRVNPKKKEGARMNKTIRYNHTLGSPLLYNSEESFVRAMNNEEVIRKAKADPDAPLINPKNFHKFKRVNF